MGAHYNEVFRLQRSHDLAAVERCVAQGLPWKVVAASTEPRPRGRGEMRGL